MELISRDSDWLAASLEGILDGCLVFGLTEDNADGRGILVATEEVIDGCNVEAHLARVLRLKLTHFQIQNNVAVELDMIEEEVKAILLAADDKRILTAQK